jgi:cytoskeleton protein RodZ
LYYDVEAADVASLGIGEALRREREHQGISLEDIARTTRIPTRFLDAIEAEDFDNLPGLVFTRNFVRQYAEALRLDAESLLAVLPRLDESTIQLPDPPARPRRRSSYSRRSSGSAFLVWSIPAIAAGIFLYTHFSHAHFDAVARIRAGIAAFRDINVNIARSRSAEAASPPAASPPASLSSSPPSSNDAPSPLPAAAPQVAAAAPASGAPVSAASSVQVVVTAIQEAWVELSADGKTSFAGILMPNERKEISAAEQVKIVAGNAGGVTVSLNGKPLEPLGPVGQVRVVRLTAEGPQFLQVIHPAAPDPL